VLFRFGVAGQLRVAREQGDALGEGLGEQQPVERILVQGRQGVDAHRVLTADGQLGVAVVQQATAQEARLDPEIVTPERALDGYFPEARGAEEQLVARVFQELACSRGEPLGLAGRPEQGLGIEQELHSPVPNRRPISASPITSKSSGTASSPARKPRRCGAGGASSAVTRASGSPALAITTDSPLSARSINFESCVLASWMLTMIMVPLVGQVVRTKPNWWWRRCHHRRRELAWRWARRGHPEAANGRAR